VKTEAPASPTIPGLDFEPPKLDEKMLYRKKIPYAKPVPRDFEQAWSGNAQPPAFRPGKQSFFDVNVVYCFPVEVTQLA
jgi:hypothetical protein